MQVDPFGERAVEGIRISDPFARLPIEYVNQYACR